MRSVSLPDAAEQLQLADPTSSEQLIRLLLSKLTRTASPCAPAVPNNSEPSEEILLDVDVDGSRYLLIRMPTMNALRTQLSPRECEIVRMVAQGYANKIIADFLGISTWTVCTHLRRVFAKLGVGSRAAMVAKIMETPNARRFDQAAARAVNGR